MARTSCFAFRKAEGNGTSLKVHALITPDPDEQMDCDEGCGEARRKGRKAVKQIQAVMSQQTSGAAF
jgi:hypothetical protein